jgi:hypothetical protein
MVQVELTALPALEVTDRYRVMLGVASKFRGTRRARVLLRASSAVKLKVEVRGGTVCREGNGGRKGGVTSCARWKDVRTHEQAEWSRG